MEFILKKNITFVGSLHTLIVADPPGMRSLIPSEDWSIHPLNTKVVEEGLKKSVDLAVILILVLQLDEIVDIPESVFIQR